MKSRQQLKHMNNAAAPWAKGLTQLQATLEARMSARSKRSLQHKLSSAAHKARTVMQKWDSKLLERKARRNGLTAWAKSLVELQQKFETRMKARNINRSKEATTPFAENLVRTQKYFQDWNAALEAKRQKHTPLTSWAKDLLKTQEKLESMLEERMESL